MALMALMAHHTPDTHHHHPTTDIPTLDIVGGVIVMLVITRDTMDILTRMAMPVPTEATEVTEAAVTSTTYRHRRLHTATVLKCK